MTLFPCENGVWLGRELNPRHKDLSPLLYQLSYPAVGKRTLRESRSRSLCKITRIEQAGMLFLDRSNFQIAAEIGRTGSEL